MLLSVGVGSVFLYSAWTKILPIQPFEYTMVEYLHFPWWLAAVAARAMVGLEAALGGLLFLHFYGRRNVVPKLAMALLIIFSIYLIGLWAVAGNDINCGCFGDAIWMSPSASLIKNGILILVLAIIMRFHSGFSFYRQPLVAGALMFIVVVLPFFLFPMTLGAPTWLRKDRYKLDLTSLYKPIVDDSDALKVPYPKTPSTDLSKGKYIVAFLSPTCEHCRIAARKMVLMKRNDPNIPFFLIIGGIASDLTDFWKTTEAKGKIPWMRLHRAPFLHYTGGVFPYIIWLNDGWVEARSTYNTLNQQSVENWLHQH